MTSTVYEEYQAYLNNASITYIKDLATGDVIRRLAPKLGNMAYARKKRSIVHDLDRAFEGLTFDQDVFGNDVHKDCHLFLLTLTYDHKGTIEEAWANLTNEVKKAKILIQRELERDINPGRTRTVKGRSNPSWERVHLRTFMVKEGQKSGWPAPHMLLILDRPIRCVKYHARKDTRYIIQNSSLWRAVKNCWKNGNSDIHAIVSDSNIRASPCRYVAKYLTKAVDATQDPLGFRMLAWAHKYRQRPMHLSRQFKNVFNPARLETYCYESQPMKGHKWVFDGSEAVDLREFHKVMLQKSKRPAPPPLPAWVQERLDHPRPWPRVSEGMDDTTLQAQWDAMKAQGSGGR